MFRADWNHHPRDAGGLVEVHKSVTSVLLSPCLGKFLVEIPERCEQRRDGEAFHLLVKQSCCQFQNASNRLKASDFSLQWTVVSELAWQRPNPPIWMIADHHSEPRFRHLYMHSQGLLLPLIPETAGAPLKIGPFPAFDVHSASEKSICISSFRCLMGRCAGFVNVLIEEVKTSQLPDPHGSMFFLSQILSRDRPVGIPWI
jgi:hypothetical protein